jgi:hypothetical protein
MKENVQMNEPRTNRATLLDAQLRFAEIALDAYIDAYAQGAKMYWAMWGPMGQMGIDAVEVMQNTQHHYLEHLRDSAEERIEPRTEPRS